MKRITLPRSILLTAGVISLLLIGGGFYIVVQSIHQDQTQRRQLDKPGKPLIVPDRDTAGNPDRPGPAHPDSAPPKVGQSAPVAPEPDGRLKPPTGVVDPSIKPPSPNTIFAAAFDGKLDKVKSLLKQQPSLVNARDKTQNATPLHWALYRKNYAVASYLLAHGADVNAKGHQGKTPLHVAALAGNTELVKAIIAKGADVNAEDRTHGTALFMAIGKGNKDTAAYLLDHKAKPDVMVTDGGVNALLVAVINKKPELVKLLLAHGANPNVKTKDGLTPLILSADQPEVTEMLAKAGATE